MQLGKLIITMLLVCSAALANALDIKPYTADALAAAQGADKPIALHFHADCCPTCRAQPVLGGALEGNRFAPVAMGVAILCGGDKWLEARLLQWLPDAWVNLTVGI